MGQVQSPVLTIDVDRLLAETAFGRRLSEEILARGEALTEENDRIAAELTAEAHARPKRTWNDYSAELWAALVPSASSEQEENDA